MNDKTDLFDQEDENSSQEHKEVENYLEALVGEDKRYKTTEDLAKATAYGQDHIQHLEEENAELRQELQTRMSVEEALATVPQKKDEMQSNTPAPQEGENSEKTVVAPHLTANEVKKLIADSLSEVGRASQAAENFKTVEQELKKRFGADTRSVLVSKAKELGMSQEEMNEMAVTKPKVFLALVGGEKPKAQNLFNPQSASIDSSKVSQRDLEGNSIDGHHTQSYWREYAKKKPNGVLNAKEAAQEMRDAIALGQDFFR